MFCTHCASHISNCSAAEKELPHYPKAGWANDSPDWSQINCLGKSQKKTTASVTFSSSSVSQYESFDRPCGKVNRNNSILSFSWYWTADRHRMGQKRDKCKSTFQFWWEWREGILSGLAVIHHSSQWPSSLNTARSFLSSRGARSW